ncbi:hypothetical protein [Deinococcus peraridilitoris]|uniref:DinB-like domain-containing protein n=1 Tax=Deinococcus peraridilitoris (strain DSM 19664 / LMG 22246 / CIP 109416 / KR-200) TaxID=937777 RepID=L0A4C4_DEIPD|nr:hypothetical protein [Deinococcus peraridilitoris]AFZ67880.1 hypothetical protein Deipe_2405 [Deinococcus peraridilitoris DSM 19664]
MEASTFLQGYLAVLQETFEGAQQEWSWYLDQDKNAGLLATLSGLSAEQASRPTPLGPSVIAHTEHVRFHLSATTAALRGETMALDWAGSWAVQQLDDRGWRELRGQLHDGYLELHQLAQDRVNWDADEAGGVVAGLTHVAYHLGVIRQLIKFL